MKKCNKCKTVPTKVRTFHVGNLETTTTTIRWAVAGVEVDLCHACSDRWLEIRDRVVSRAKTAHSRTEQKTAWFDYRDLAVKSEFQEFIEAKLELKAA